jgi:hypothetical protein
MFQVWTEPPIKSYGSVVILSKRNHQLDDILLYEQVAVRP